MATFIYPISASFGSAKSGQAANVGFRVLASDGSTLIARTSVGVSERLDAAGNATTGIYVVSAALDPTWGFVRVVWDIAGMAGVVAEDTLNASQAYLSSGVKIDLTQAVPTSNTAQTIGDALNAARAQAFGKWTLTGTTLSLYAADGITVVRTFTLDSATAPKVRS